MIDALAVGDLVAQIPWLCRFDPSGELRAVVVVQLGAQLAREDDVTLQRQPDLHVDRLVAVVANSLDPLLVIVPPGDGVILADLRPLLTAEVFPAFRVAEPEVVAPASQSEALVDDLRIAPRFSSISCPIGTYLVW